MQEIYPLDIKTIINPLFRSVGLFVQNEFKFNSGLVEVYVIVHAIYHDWDGRWFTLDWSTNFPHLKTCHHKIMKNQKMCQKQWLTKFNN